jgi:hypothetical protein
MENDIIKSNRSVKKVALSLHQFSVSHRQVSKKASDVVRSKFYAIVLGRLELKNILNDKNVSHFHYFIERLSQKNSSTMFFHCLFPNLSKIGCRLEISVFANGLRVQVPHGADVEEALGSHQLFVLFEEVLEGGHHSPTHLILSPYARSTSLLRLGDGCF